VETEALAQGLFELFAPESGRVLVLADWTDVPNGKLLVFSIPANGRSIPLLAKSVAKKAGEGAMIRAENEGLEALRRICGQRSDVVVVADRGFGNQRWVPELTRLGFRFVQRVNSVFFADTEHYIGKLDEMDLRNLPSICDWGRGTLGEDQRMHGRLVSAFDPEAKEPWFLFSDLDEDGCEQVVNIYRRRWWIETTFRDNKNRNWGLGLANVTLRDHRRYERLFCIVALAFIFLSAHGAAAEQQGFDKGCKANTRKIRVLNLLRLGRIFIRKCGAQLYQALEALKRLVGLDYAPNWG